MTVIDNEDEGVPRPAEWWFKTRGHTCIPGWADDTQIILACTTCKDIVLSETSWYSCPHCGVPVQLIALVVDWGPL